MKMLILFILMVICIIWAIVSLFVYFSLVWFIPSILFIIVLMYFMFYDNKKGDK